MIGERKPFVRQFMGGGLCSICGRLVVLTTIDTTTGMRFGRCCESAVKSAHAALEEAKLQHPKRER